MPEALRRAYRDALRLHEGRCPPLPPVGTPLDALDDWEQAMDVWREEWLRLRAALLSRGSGRVAQEVA